LQRSILAKQTADSPPSVVGMKFFDRRRNMLNNIGLPGLLLIAVVVLVLFGRGKISSLMGEVGKGITSFKKGINEGEKEQLEDNADDVAEIPQPDVETKDKV
jgi:sec-independent protein translocase protein TatA|tara:strand:+ start:531 stop:836 length:306 start_codon:yes stop_codon:yes gene_type:complete